MKNNYILCIFIVFFSAQVVLAQNNTCLGVGTVFFYGNGMFNTRRDAQQNLDVLVEEVLSQGLVDLSKEIRFDLAYKTNESICIQFFNVVSQKGIDNWEDFWLWLSSTKKAPKWFQDLLKAKAEEVLKNGTIAFDDIQEQFETYSRYIRNGYNVILVSHSQGNFYANQAMRKLSEYTDASLTGSISEKRRKNLLFPEFFDLFANVQVATPASATVNSSPWTTFIDDLLIDSVRRTPLGALPANLKTPGSNIPPDGDPLGHNFIKAYLRNKESKEKILSDIQAKYQKLKYPIAYFKKAFLLESHWRHFGDGNKLHSPDASLYFKVQDVSNREVGGYDERRPSENDIVSQMFAECFELPLGLSKILLEVSTEDSESKEVSFDYWPSGDKDIGKPTVITFPVKEGHSDWEVGSILTERGSGKEPIQVNVEIYQTPKPKNR